MPAPFLIDLTHTSHTQARTGIQRVTRSLYAALGNSAVAITHDPYARQWRTLRSQEISQLSLQGNPGKKRSAQWPLSLQWSGRWQRLTGRPSLLPLAQGLIVPEVFSPAVAVALPALLRNTSGPRIAIFHDAIALKLPELSPAKTVARFPSYLQELLAFDGIAAVSEDSRQTLIDYWQWLGVKNTPPVIALPLGIDSLSPTAGVLESTSLKLRPSILSVGTIEGRKNHLALLEACKQLWAGGRTFDLVLIGIAHAQTGRAALEKIENLQRAGRPIHYAGSVDDARLEQAYRDCTFTVYPSIMEGFGLPVLESLARGKPCICSRRGALGESALAGGCLALDAVDPVSIASAIDQLLSRPELLNQLTAETRRRSFKRWSDYASELTVWMSTLPRRAP